MARVCRFYGWTIEYALDMPASRFFLMHRTALRVYAMERHDDTQIQAVSIAIPEYCENQLKRFSKASARAGGARPRVQNHHTAPVSGARPVLDWKDPQATRLIKRAFLAKRSMIHGG